VSVGKKRKGKDKLNRLQHNELRGEPGSVVEPGIELKFKNHGGGEFGGWNPDRLEQLGGNQRNHRLGGEGRPKVQRTVNPRKKKKKRGEPVGGGPEKPSFLGGVRQISQEKGQDWTKKDCFMENERS